MVTHKHGQVGQKPTLVKMFSWMFSKLGEKCFWTEIGPKNFFTHLLGFDANVTQYMRRFSQGGLTKEGVDYEIFGSEISLARQWEEGQGDGREED